MSKLFTGVQDLAAIRGPSAVSIGNFDGVHLGHQYVIKSLLESSSDLQVQAVVVTFEPLAKEYFRPGSVARLSSLEQRADLLFELGVDAVVCLPFTAEFAAMTAQNFVQQVLVEALAVRYLSVGDDFRFGKDRAGDFKLLQQMGQQHNFTVTAHDTFELAGERVSSGRVRAALQADDLALAAKLLGRGFAISGTVVQGQQLGRTLSFPTANLLLPDGVLPVNGVFAVRVELQDQRRLEGVANIGNRPTVGGTQNRLEVHIFDFNEDIYTQKLEVILVKKLRAEQKFDSLEQLRDQIAVDAAQARQYFTENPE